MKVVYTNTRALNALGKSPIPSGYRLREDTSIPFPTDVPNLRVLNLKTGRWAAPTTVAQATGNDPDCGFVAEPNPLASPGLPAHKPTLFSGVSVPNPPHGYSPCTLDEFYASNSPKGSFAYYHTAFQEWLYATCGPTYRRNPAILAAARRIPTSRFGLAPAVPVGYILCTPGEYNTHAKNGDDTYLWWLPGSVGWTAPVNPLRKDTPARNGFLCCTRKDPVNRQPQPTLPIPEGYVLCTAAEYSANARRGSKSYMIGNRTGKWDLPATPEGCYESPGVFYARLAGRTEHPADKLPPGYEPCSLEVYLAKRKTGDDTFLKAVTWLENWYVPSSSLKYTPAEIERLKHGNFKVCRKLPANPPAAAPLVTPLGFPPIPAGFVLVTREDVVESGNRVNQHPADPLNKNNWKAARAGDGDWHEYLKPEPGPQYGELRIVRPESLPSRPRTSVPKLGTVLVSKAKDDVGNPKWRFVLVSGLKPCGNVDVYRLHWESVGNYVWAEALEELTREDGSPCGDVDPWWNPDVLTQAELDPKNEGWRLLTEGEVASAKGERIPGTSWWNGARGWYVGLGAEGSQATNIIGRKFTLRTKAPLPTYK